MHLEVREAALDDLEAIKALDRATARSAGKTDADYISRAEGGFERMVLVLGSPQPCQAPLGFLVASGVDDRWEIENIAIALEYRRHGWGRELLRHFLNVASSRGTKNIFLEVRASNGAAIALYTSAGFAQDGVRKSYYSHPAEDALLFSISLQNAT